MADDLTGPRAGTVARVRAILAFRDFRYLFGLRVASQFGDGLFQAVLVGSVVFSPEKQSTTVGFAKAIAILTVPYSVLGPFAGVFIDRWKRRRILVLTPILRAGAALLILPGTSAAVPFYAGALFVLSANRFLLTTAGSVTPRLVPSGDLLVANSITTVGGTVTTIIGVVGGGQLIDPIGYGPLVGITAGFWLITSFLAARMRASLAPLRPPQTGRVVEDLGRVARELRDGARRLAHTPRALAPVVSITFDQFLQGLVLVVSLVVFRDRFRSGVGSFSWLVGAGGVGLAAGLLTVPPLERLLTRRGLMVSSFVAAGASLVGVAPAIDRFTVLIPSFVIGLAYAWKKIPADTMVQEAVADAYRGRVFSIYDVGQNMSRVVAAVAAIAFVRAGSAAWVVAGAGLAYALWAPVLAGWLRRAATIRVRLYAGSRADETPRAVEIGGVEEPVEVERSWREDRAGARLLCFRLRLRDGTRIEVSKRDDDERWRLDRELPA